MEIEGYPDYLIFPDGKVSSKRFPSKYLKAGGKTYKCVGLWKDGKRGKTLKIHRLVAIHYISNPENYKEVDHIDRDKSNNNIDNLRWVDRIENLKNQSVRKNNKIGIKNICYVKKKYQFKKDVNGVSHVKYLDTLEEAIEYKNKFESYITLN